MNSTDDLLLFIVVLNSAPVYSGSLTAINTNELTSGSYTVPAFTDPDGDTITYSVTLSNGSALDSSWINFNATTRVLNYTTLDTTTSYSFKVTAQDIYNTPTEMSFVMNVDLKPRVNTSITALSSSMVSMEVSTFQINGKLFSDEDSTLSYQLKNKNGTAAPTWLSVIPPASASDNITIQGSSPTFMINDFELLLIATDSKGQTNNVTIHIYMTGNFFIKYILHSEMSLYLIDMFWTKHR